MNKTWEVKKFTAAEGFGPRGVRSRGRTAAEGEREVVA
jgi:hypothetical protein